MEENLGQNNKVTSEKSTNNNDTSNMEEKNISNSEKINNQEKEINIAENVPNSNNNLISRVNNKNENEKPSIPKPKKELPIEKKPFQEFINSHLIPSLKEEINLRGFEINHINLKNTNRPIAGDKCWVINCEIKDICSFWLSFETDDISSLKSISISKPNQKPSIIESFLIDEKRITLKLIISRVLQRLNGQKLIGVN
ncbi:MAG: DUF2996 domain-containing protein [Prochlorococcus marinus CUG1435]|nr:DUF2996 domain-containing protein [Prochlorococcus marinus CUG1435]